MQKNPNILYKKLETRKGYMGYITKIGYALRDTKIDAIKQYLKGIDGWDKFVVYVCNQENIETGVLGGRTRYRHLTADDIISYTAEEVKVPVSDPEQFYNPAYWTLPVAII